VVPYYESVDTRYLQNQENREEVGQYHLLSIGDVDMMLNMMCILSFECEEKMERKVTRLFYDDTVLAHN
jgi:hypothetical protein